MSPILRIPIKAERRKKKVTTYTRANWKFRAKIKVDRMSLSHKLVWTWKLIFGIDKMKKVIISLSFHSILLERELGRKVVDAFLWLINSGVI